MASSAELSEFYVACRNNEIDKVRELLSTMSLSEINKKESNGSTALHAATFYGHKEIIKMLLERGASRSIVNNFGCKPYDEAPTPEIKELFKRQIGNTRFVAGSGATEWICFTDSLDYQNSVYNATNEKQPLDQWRIDWIREFYVDKDMPDIEGIDIIREFYRLARNDPVYLIRAYTAETDYYRLLNQHLAITNPTPMSRPVDDEGGRWYRLRDLVGIIASHDNMEPFIFKGTVFRGMRLTSEELSLYEKPLKKQERATLVGTGRNDIRYIVNKTFLSTSKDYNIAKSFAFGGTERHTKSGQLIKIPTICRYFIKSNDRIALDVERISEYSHECEVLILPGQTFEVKAINKNVPTLDGLMNEIILEEHVKEKLNEELYADFN